MRKSERIRLLEMEMLRMQFQIEYISKAIDILLQENKVAGPELDAGKWYNTKLNKDKETLLTGLGLFSIISL